MQGLGLFLVRVGLVFCSPLLLQQIIRNVEHLEVFTSSQAFLYHFPKEPTWHGILFCLGLFATSTIAVFLDHHGLQRLVVAAIQMRFVLFFWSSSSDDLFSAGMRAFLRFTGSR